MLVFHINCICSVLMLILTKHVLLNTCEYEQKIDCKKHCLSICLNLHYSQFLINRGDGWDWYHGKLKSTGTPLFVSKNAK